MRILLIFLALNILPTCQQSAFKKETGILDARTFAKKLGQTKKAVVLDVRTPEEYKRSHLPNGVNISWTDPLFDGKIQNVDRHATVFVYCLSGSRSAEAARFMRKNGYTTVYELNGGILTWQEAGLPLKVSKKAESMSLADFQHQVEKGRILIDFHAAWCQPCKKMAPYLQRTAEAQGLTLWRINVDEHPTLSRQLKVYALPYLQVRQDGKKIWDYTGFLDEGSLTKYLQEIPLATRE